jgi:hypothetical protein
MKSTKIKKKKRKLTLKDNLKSMTANSLIRTFKSAPRTITCKCFRSLKMEMTSSLKIRCAKRHWKNKNINYIKCKLTIWDSYRNSPTVLILILIWMLCFNPRILIKLLILFLINQRKLKLLLMLTNKNDDFYLF